MKSPRELGPGLTLTLVATLAVAACNQAQEKSYETDAEDVSGGELIASEADPEAVPVDTPDAPMTSVPAEADEAASE